MARLLHVSQEWDFSRYGTSTIAWTDASGAHVTSFTTGIYRHPTSAADSLTHPDGGTVTNTANASFAAALQTAMDAATAQTVTVSYDNDTNRYTITCTGGTLTINWSGTPQLLMRKLLGFAANLSGDTTYTSTQAPYFSLEPRVVGMVGWTDVIAMADSVKTRISSSGDLVRIGPERVGVRGKFDLTHETDAQTLSEYETLFSWQTLWFDAGRYGRMCYLIDANPPVGSNVRWAFRLMAPVFDESTHRREKVELRNRWRISIDALLRGRF